MPWTDSFKLAWTDFKDQPDKNAHAVAITASGITFGYTLKQADKQVISFTTSVVGSNTISGYLNIYANN